MGMKGINFLKRKFFTNCRASFVDLEYIWILSIASFLIEIIAKYPQKAGDKNAKNPILLGLGWLLIKIQRDLHSRNNAPSSDKKFPF